MIVGLISGGDRNEESQYQAGILATAVRAFGALRSAGVRSQF